VSRLERICQQEGIRIEDSSLKLIARSATGSMRDAENMLEQLVAYYGSEIDPHQVQSMLGVTGDIRAQELAKHIISKDVAAGLQTINSVTQDGLDLRQFNRELMEYLRGLLLAKAGAAEAADLSPEVLAEIESLAKSVSMEQISKALKLFRQVDLEFDGFSTLPLELALVECALTEGEKTPEVTKAAPKKEKLGIAPAPAALKETPAAPQAEEEAKMPAVEAAEEVQEFPLPELSDDIAYFRSRWKDVVSATKGMGSSGNLDALLRSACEPVALDGDTIVLGFYFEFHMEKIEDPKYRHMVESKASEIFGKPYKIRCILTEREKKPPVQQSKSQGHLVDAALKMGARIVEEGDE
ncbi:MAG: hypothetical protein WBC55_06755, partial [Dehalococcoidia bacterium]